jgi:hypothetical protein
MVGMTGEGAAIRAVGHPFENTGYLATGHRSDVPRTGVLDHVAAEPPHAQVLVRMVRCH